MDYFIVIILILISAFFSGSTLGFFSLNRGDLERKAKLGDKKAKKVYNLRKNGNLLLCTILIVIFGEIIPQAVFSRYALKVGSKMAWLVHLTVWFFYPVCRPMAWVLDKALGDEIPTVYSKRELIKMVKDHEELQNSEIDADEERIIRGALSFSDKTVESVMTPRTGMFALHHEETLNRRTISEISNSGHSRIPVYKKDRDEIIGTLYVKDLIKKDWRGKKAGDAARRDVIFVNNEKHLDKVLNDFKRTRHHLFIVVSKFGDVVGLVTIEDILEEIIGEEIVDEFDKVDDLREEAKRKFKKRKINTV